MPYFVPLSTAVLAYRAAANLEPAPFPSFDIEGHSDIITITIGA